MNIRKLLIPSFLVCSLLAFFSRLLTKGLQRSASEKPLTKENTYDSIDFYIEAQMRRYNIPGVSLAIIESDRIVHLKCFGRAHPNGDKPTSQTPFFIGSLTKSFTALAVMQLVEAGKVELDAPIQRYLPWFQVADRDASAQMTVRHLLHQTSSLPGLLGMSNLGDMDSHPDAAERQIRALSDLKLTRPVGAKFEYSNTNYNILGLVIEAASGEPYEDYMRKHIFDPLNMSHSYTSKELALENGLAMGYRYWFGQPVPAPNLPIPIGSLASGQLISCSEDMAHYLIAHVNGGRIDGKQILSQSGIDEMHRGVAEIKEMGMSLGFYGMGWISQENGGSRIVSHSGIVPDSGAFMALVPEQKKGIVLLYNANHAMIKITLDEVWMGAAQLLAGYHPSPQRFGVVPRFIFALFLIPLLQIAEVWSTLRMLRRWRSDPANRPRRLRLWGRHILLPLFPSLLAALISMPIFSGMGGFIRLFMPDYSLLAFTCGSFACVWSVMRNWLILDNYRKFFSTKKSMENNQW